MILAWLLVAFIAIPMIELALLIQIGQHLGTGGTLALVILTGIAGAFLAKLQGLRVINQIRRELGAARLPAARLLDGVMILLAAALLMTPGLLTDAVGFALLIPPVRAALRAGLRRKLEQSIQTGRTTVFWSGPTLDIEDDDEVPPC